jgi:hypothetical protein
VGQWVLAVAELVLERVLEWREVVSFPTWVFLSLATLLVRLVWDTEVMERVVVAVVLPLVLPMVVVSGQKS